MLVEWKDEYSVGIDVIDGHHQKLLELLNKSYSLILQESNQAELSELLEELINYAKYHFSTEEDFMRKHHYHRLDQHIIEHFSFTNKVLSFRKEITEGKKYLSVDIFDFIKHWLLDHIITVDAAMSKEIRFKQCA